LKADRVWLEVDKRRVVRHAVEIRHESFRDERFFKLLRKHNVALVIADTAKEFPRIEQVTADFIYARLHGEDELYVSGYTPASLDEWARRFKQIRKEKDLYVYFDNSAKVYSPRDAMALSQRMEVGIDFEQLKRGAAYSGRSKPPRDTPRPTWGN
jgi:uncharacterized protein YecE (DUF72 family)